MAENENGQEKTEQPTPKRLDKSREEGQVARSRELTITLGLLAGAAGMIIWGNSISHAMLGVMRHNFAMPREVVFDTQLMFAQLATTMTMAVEALLPLFILLIIAALVGPTALGGFLFSGKALAPKAERIDPLKGIKRIFSMNSLVELLKSVGKVLLISGFAVAMVMFYYPQILGLSSEPLQFALQHTLSIIGWSILFISSAMILIAVVDVPWQIFEHNKKMMMTRQEVKDEMKDTEGKPEVKSRVRYLQREMAQRRMMESIPEADVVITNPEHFSVALKYDMAGGGAPIVLAKGVDFIAMKIREVANAHDVMLIEAAPLARAIYFTTEIDDEIPGNLYMAVAQVLAYVFQLKSHQQGKGRKPKPLGELELPRESLYDTEGNPAPEVTNP